MGMGHPFGVRFCIRGTCFWFLCGRLDRACRRDRRFQFRCSQFPFGSSLCWLLDLVFVVLFYFSQPARPSCDYDNSCKIHVGTFHFSCSFCFRSWANSSACLRSSALGLPLFIPPKYLRKPFVLKPLH